jgi:hypothetical protein
MLAPSPTPAPLRLLPFAAALTVTAAGLVPLAAEGRWLPAAVWHVVFAVAALPMILAAMAYFIPVLTRSGEAPAALALAPLAAGLGGLGIVAHFALGGTGLRHGAPWLALLAVAGFSFWLVRRARACFGAPHPGLRWYAAALAMIALALLAVGLAPLWPEQARALRLLHLHLNTLGFMGLTALGTLHVLLPTVAGRPAPDTAARLRGDLPWSVAGVLCTAVGAAWAPTLALAGLLLYAWPVVRLLATAWRTWRPELLAAGSVLPLLVSALLGLLVALLHGALHGLGLAPGGNGIAPFVLGFLLPLVSGAAGQLLPVWLAPGPQTDWHRAARRRLAAGARLRAGLLALAGTLAAAGMAAAYPLALFCALWLVVAMMRVALGRKAP